MVQDDDSTLVRNKSGLRYFAGKLLQRDGTEIYALVSLDNPTSLDLYKDPSFLAKDMIEHFRKGEYAGGFKDVFALHKLSVKRPPEEKVRWKSLFGMKDDKHSEQTEYEKLVEQRGGFVLAGRGYLSLNPEEKEEIELFFRVFNAAPESASSKKGRILNRRDGKNY
ncbi:MAG TPA: hypothetical protein VJ343_03345 [archaeon]|nr:hypothetical protein [archaeon]